MFSNIHSPKLPSPRVELIESSAKRNGKTYKTQMQKNIEDRMKGELSMIEDASNWAKSELLKKSELKSGSATKANILPSID